MPKLVVLILLMSFFCTRPTRTFQGPRPELSALARQGNTVLRTGDLAGAERLFQQGLIRAQGKADWVYVSGFLTSLGAVRVREARYRQALDYFHRSQDAARQAGSAFDAGFATFNIGVLYTRLGDWHRGHAAMLEAMRDMDRVDPRRLPSTLYVSLADCESHDRRYAEADRYFRLAIEHLERYKIEPLIASTWERWGLSYLERGDLEAAERCLLEAYRRHRLAQRAEAEQVHYGLARLALAQGNLPEARRRATQYLAAAKAQPLFYPLWEAYRVCAEIEEKDGHLAQAYELSLRGIDWARRTRADRLPAAQLLASAESAMQSLYLGLIRVAQQLHARKPDAALLVAALEAGEEGRAAALTDQSGRLRDEYWQALDALQRVQAQRLAEDNPALERETASLRTRLVGLESLAGLPPSEKHRELIASARRMLGDNDALVVFRTGEPDSFAWLITAKTLELRSLPSSQKLLRQVARFRQDTQGGQALASASGKELFIEIFGEFSHREHTNIRWTLVPDGPLHELPFAALPWPTSSGTESYLVEHRTLQLAPSVATIAAAPGSVPTGPTFAGIADPIYNAADPRLAPMMQRADMLSVFRRQPATFELARLPGSRRELDAAVETLQPTAPIILTGGDVNRESFLSVLARHAATLHIATHVVPEPGDPRHALIALGMNPKSRQQELVGADEISASQHGARLVVMSGCGTGRGESLPGAGLLSLTRAWLHSGAQGVVASHWPVPDHSGMLFTHFYRYARPARSSVRESEVGRWAAALQQAQIAAIRQDLPASVWAAYFFTGRN